MMIQSMTTEELEEKDNEISNQILSLFLERALVKTEISKRMAAFKENQEIYSLEFDDTVFYK